MYADRGTAMLIDPDQWARCAHAGTVALPGGGVGLDWTEVAPASRWDPTTQRCRPAESSPPAVCPGGISHDRWCRTWRSRPDLGTVEVRQRGTAPRAGCPDGLRHPTGVAIDQDDRLYVVEAAARVVLVADLWSGRVLDRVPIPGRPRDVVAGGGADRPGVLVLTDTEVVRLEGRRGPCPGPGRLTRPCGHRGLDPVRITVLAGRVLVLWRDTRNAVVADLTGRELLEVVGATDLEGSADGLLAVAGQPGEPIHRFSDESGALIEDEPVAAADYDGGAVTINPAGRIVYTTAAGSRTTQGRRARHLRRGTVTTYRLDSGAYRTRWGRVFIDACLPTGTGLLVRSLTSDEDDVDDPMPAAPPGRGATPVRSADLTPPLPPIGALASVGPTPVVRRSGVDLAGVDHDGADHGDDHRGDHRGDHGLDQGWTGYESGVTAGPGRYLWLQLELTGTERTSPTVRSLQVERPGHALLSALPRMFSSVDAQADFLHGFLTPAEGLLHDLDTGAADRRRLVDPLTAPVDFLPWLASLAGIVLDQRWPEAARRSLLAEVYPLWARRGTAAALARMLQLYLGRRIEIVERWRLRGLGGGILSLDPNGLDAPTVGGSTRASGMLGHFTIGGERPEQSSYDRFAHRFTVLVPGCLTAEQREVVTDIIGAQKPSHTLGDVCEVGNGLPVGRLRLGLTAYVGPRAGRSTSVLGEAPLGHASTLGTPSLGARIGASRLGGVRVG